MSERGVFAVDRGLFDHDMFADEPFTEREAFIWLVSEAAFKARKKRVGPHAYELSRGQLAHSVRFLGNRWKWSKSRVDRFINRLGAENAISKSIGTVAGQSINIITICNYDTYQILALPKIDGAGTVVGQSRDKLEDTKHIEKEVTKDVTSKRATPRTELSKVLDAEHTQALIEYRQRIKSPLTGHSAKLLAGKLSKRGNPNENADTMMARGWRGFEPDWLESRGGEGRAPPQSDLMAAARANEDRMADL